MDPLSLLALAPLALQQATRLPSADREPLREVVYYDYVEDGVLKGGFVLVDPEDPLLADVPTGGEEAAASPFVTVLDNGPSANRIDLVFVGDGYTSAELGAYASHVAAIYPTFLQTQPLSDYATYFNIHRVDVVSAESGVDNDPTQGISRNTALDMGFWCGGTERLLCVNVSKARNQAASAPEVDQVIAVANSTKYGGAGYNDLATLAGNNGSAIELMLHEFGHAFPDLADEYDYGGPTTWTGGEPSAENVSTFDEAAMTSGQKKWYRWLSHAKVSTFEGANYSQLGIYRPTDNSKMRSLGRPFQVVNAEQLVREIYLYVDPIDAASPPGTYTRADELFVTPMRPTNRTLDIQWSLAGMPIPGATGETLTLSKLRVPRGVYPVSVQVVDNTNRVRDPNLRASLMTSTRSWTFVSYGRVRRTGSLPQ